MPKLALISLLVLLGLGLNIADPQLSTSEASELSCEICQDDKCEPVGSWDTGWANCWTEPFCLCLCNPWPDNCGEPCDCQDMCKTSESCEFDPGGW